MPETFGGQVHESLRQAWGLPVVKPYEVAQKLQQADQATTLEIFFGKEAAGSEEYIAMSPNDVVERLIRSAEASVQAIQAQGQADASHIAFMSIFDVAGNALTNMMSGH